YNFAREDFSWSTDYVFTYNDNEVININSDTPLTTGGIGLNYNLARIQPGYPINVFYGFVQDGIFQTQAEIDNAAVQSPGTNPATSTAPGDIRFRDLNNDGRITDDDRTFIGNPNPDFTFSLNNTFRYKN
ncbi:SusC/RagA family TonB-linked outer membrane protein, partial [Salinimicrobium sp. CDJ15-91]|nr:SusC/RagA family TonB-linked outer membrane protein [Salinimicrobium oceani]